MKCRNLLLCLLVCSCNHELPLDEKVNDGNTLNTRSFGSECSISGPSTVYANSRCTFSLIAPQPNMGSEAVYTIEISGLGNSFNDRFPVYFYYLDDYEKGVSFDFYVEDVSDFFIDVFDSNGYFVTSRYIKVVQQPESVTNPPFPESVKPTFMASFAVHLTGGTSIEIDFFLPNGTFTKETLSGWSFQHIPHSFCYNFNYNGEYGNGGPEFYPAEDYRFTSNSLSELNVTFIYIEPYTNIEYKYTYIIDTSSFTYGIAETRIMDENDPNVLENEPYYCNSEF